MTQPFTVEQLRCLELSAIIREELEGVELNMACYRGYCGSAGCIAGHTIALYDPEAWEEGVWDTFHYKATNLLGLSTRQASALFIPWQNGGPALTAITPAMAAATLENFALTGKVVWE